jgi:hypothetical protein
MGSMTAFRNSERGSSPFTWMRTSTVTVARIVLVHRDLIAKIGNCRRWPTYDLVLRCEGTLATGGELARLWPEIETERARLRLLAAHDRLSAKLLAAGT